MIKIPVVFTFDENYAAGASVAIQSLLASKHKDTKYEIYVLYGSLEEETKRKLSQWCDINWIYLKPELFKGLPCSNKYTLPAWYSSIVPEVMPKDLTRAIYSDVDVLFKGDLTELYNMDLHGNYLGAVPGGWNMGTFPHSDKMGYVIYTGSIMVLDLKQLRAVHSWQLMVEAGKKYFQDIKCRQMGIMNIVAKDKIEPIPVKYEIFDTSYRDRLEDVSFNEYQDFFTMLAARKDVRRVHYTVDGEKKKIWEWPLEQIPEEYRQYLLKSGLYGEN